MANEEMVPDNVEVVPPVAVAEVAAATTEPPAEVAAEAEPAAEEAEVEQPTAEAQSQEEIEDWREKQIARQHKKIKDQERAMADMRAMLEARNAAQPQTEEAAAQPAAPVSEDEINRRAAAIAEANRYQERLTSLNEEGEKSFGKDWGSALNRLTQIGDGTMPDLPWIMNALPDKAAKLLVDLGKNPAEMLRISELPVERRQAEYFRKAMMTVAPTPKKPSAAPAPVEPLKPRTAPVVGPTDADDDETWYAKRQAQREARQAQRGARR